jgi:putative flippase GtrA
VGLTVFYVLPLGLSALWANFIAFCIAYLVSYYGNAILVFPETKLGPASFFRFLTVSLVSLSLNQAIVYALVGVLAWPYWQALIVVLMVVPPTTYLALKYWGVRGTGSGAR